MFAFTPPNLYCSNPFGATMLNPKINFCLGMAAATTHMTMYNPIMGGSLFMQSFNYPVMPQQPVFGYGFNNINALTGFNQTINNNSFNSYNNFSGINTGFNLNSYMNLLTKQMQSFNSKFNFNPYLEQTTKNTETEQQSLVDYNAGASKIKPGLLKGNLVGKEAVITQLCQKYNVDIALVVTIIGQESGFGTSNLAQHNNFMGYRAAGDLGKNAKGFGYFSTPEKGLEKAIANIAKYPERYASVKKADMNNIDAIGKIYCEGDTYASAIKNLYNKTVKNYLA